MMCVRVSSGLVAAAVWSMQCSRKFSELENSILPWTGWLHNGREGVWRMEKGEGQREGREKGRGKGEEVRY